MADEEQTPPKPDHEPPAGAETTARWTGGAKPLGYTATAKWLVLRKKEKPSAEIFSVSYVAEGGDTVAAGRVRLQRRAGRVVGVPAHGRRRPQRVDFPADGTLPELPPKLVQNESSWLGFADLVFVDPVGTGFSRIIENEPKKDEKPGEGEKTDPNEYFGQKRDLESLCEFMSALALRERPLGLADLHRRRELRRLPRRAARADAPGGDRHRPQRRDPDLAGARADRARPGRLQRDDVGRPAADDGGRRSLPRQVARLPGRDVPRRRARAAPRTFASGDYATFLIRGAYMAAAERERTLSRLADFLGLPLELVARAEGRVNPFFFARELLRDERKIAGFYDITITGTDPFPDRLEQGATPDPTLAGIGPAYTAAVNRQLRSEIGVETDREYRLLSLEVNQAWKEDTQRHFFAPPEGATDSFRYGMSLNPHLKAFLTHGRYDMATPYYASDRLRNLMRLDPDTAGRLTVRHFEGGHMFYAWEESRHAFTAAIEEFVAGALAG